MRDMTRPFSVRMDDRTHDELQAHARRAQANQSRLVNRYVKEGLRMDAHPAIAFRTTSLGRRTTVLAARPGLQVIDVIGTWRDDGQDIAATARYLDISEEDVRAVLRYYADYRDEVDRDLKEHVDAQESYRRVLETRQAQARRRATRV
jgi:hypothetical protein